MTFLPLPSPFPTSDPSDPSGASDPSDPSDPSDALSPYAGHIAPKIPAVTSE